MNHLEGIYSTVKNISVFRSKWSKYTDKLHRFILTLFQIKFSRTLYQKYFFFTYARTMQGLSCKNTLVVSKEFPIPNLAWEVFHD